MNNPPEPECKAFLICGKIVDEPDGSKTLGAITTKFVAPSYPAAMRAGFFSRITSGHGHYALEVALEDANGQVLWRDGPPNPVPMPDPLWTHDFVFRLRVPFPAPATYNFVLFANGEEIARQRFLVHQTPQPAAP